MNRWLLGFCVLLSSGVWAGDSNDPTYRFNEGFEDEYDARPWEEVAVSLPPQPKEQALLSFYVSETARHQYRVDANSLSVGADGVVRYILVVDSAGGARNISFEGMRCQTRELRRYAYGSRSGKWRKARENEWHHINAYPGDMHHASLYYGYFCATGHFVKSKTEAVDALRSGGHPSEAAKYGK